MFFLDESIRGFLLHESSIKKISYEASRLILEFNRGFRNKNHEELANCKIIIAVKNMRETSISSFLSIYKSTEGRYCTKSTQLSLSKFSKMLLKGDFIIESEFYSEFERAILLFGYISNHRIELKITDIEQLEFLFE